MSMVRSAIILSLMASASPLAAQTALNERPGMWISARPAPQGTAAEVTRAPSPAPLIASGGSGGVLLDATGETRGVILSHPSVVAPDVQRPLPSAQRPRPRPTDLVVTGTGPLIVDAAYSGPRPSRRPREVETDSELPPIEVAVIEALRDAEPAVVEPQDTPAVAAADAVGETFDAVAMAETLAVELAGEAREIMATAPQAGADEGMATEGSVAFDPALIAAGQSGPSAPIPNVVQAVSRMSPMNQPAALSAVLLPGVQGNRRPAVQPAAFLVPQEDSAPVLSRPRPEGPPAQEGVSAPLAPHASPLSAVLLPGESPVPIRARAPASLSVPSPDAFPYSALPQGALPHGPDALDQTAQPQPPASEPMAAVLLTDPRPAPLGIAPLAMPDMPLAEDLPDGLDTAPDLPEPDFAALDRMISEAAICWQYANLSAEAGWASLSVEVALDEMNMPAAGSIRLIGFARVLSSSASEAYGAARTALVACAEASEAQPATQPATLVFDRDGVRLR
ncbi:hypothetical protein HKCCE4037_08095 [Rhodobacterales bacterium HKCCE4037]|nr:hypothetical protein [Rhodobacterales bacterium HKCCE4037]